MKISASTIPSRVASGMNSPKNWDSIAGYGWKSALLLQHSAHSHQENSNIAVLCASVQFCSLSA
jgi:hypothetical protein